MFARYATITALAAGAIAMAAPALAQQRAPVQAPSNIQRPADQDQDQQRPVISQRTSGLARDAAQSEARRERDRSGQAYAVRCASIREVIVSSLMVTIECDREDRFGDNRYDFYVTPPRRYRESRISRFPRDWLAERLVETAYEVQRTRGAAIELSLMRSSSDPNDGNLWVVSSFSIVYPD